MRYNTINLEDSFGFEVPQRFLPDDSIYKEDYAVGEIVGTAQERYNTNVTCSQDVYEIKSVNCSPFYATVLSFNKLKRTTARQYVNIVELIGQIFGFYEFLVILGYLLNMHIQHVSFKYLSVKETYGSSFMKEQIGITSFWQYFIAHISCCSRRK